MCCGVFLVHPTVVSVLLSALVERCFVSRMRDFLYRFKEEKNLVALFLLLEIKNVCKFLGFILDFLEFLILTPQKCPKRDNKKL